MMRKLSSLRGWLAALALVLAMAVGARADTLRLKDGRVLEGTVDRESSGTVWFKYKVGGVEKSEMFLASEISGLERTAAATPTAAPKPEQIRVADPKGVPAETAKAPESKPAESKGRTVGVPRIAVITLGEGHEKDMVGIFMTAEAL